MSDKTPPESPPNREATAYWLHVYSAAILAIEVVVALFYFWRLVPMAAQAYLMAGAEIPVVLRWQIAVSIFVESWLFFLIVAAAPLGSLMLRFTHLLPVFLHSGHFAAMLAVLATAALLATLLLGFWSMAYLFYDTTEVISG